MNITTGFNDTAIRRAHWCGFQLGRWEIRVGILSLFQQQDFTWALPMFRLQQQRWHQDAEGILRHTITLGIDIFALNIARRYSLFVP